MKRKTSNSPYPVLYPAGNDYLAEQGYVQAHFNVAGDPEVRVGDGHELIVDFNVELTDATLKGCVESGAAKYYVNIECGHTYFRKAYVQADAKFHIEIPCGKVADVIEIFVGLVAAKDIDGYSAPGFAERFGKAKFDLETGDILAVGSGWTVELESVDGSVEPFIQVACDKDPDEARSDIWVDSSQDKLVIHLQQDIYNAYYNNKSNDRKQELIALVIKPAILSALNAEVVRAQMAAKADGTEVKVRLDEHRWLRKLDGLIERVMDLENQDWDINEVKVDGDRDPGTLGFAVGRLLKRPLAKAMDVISKKVR